MESFTVTESEATEIEAGEARRGDPSPEELAAALLGEEFEEDSATQAEGSDNIVELNPEDSSGEPDGEGRQEQAKPTTFEELAEGSGLSVEELFKLELNLGGDEDNVATIGQLKDALKDERTLELRTLEFEDSVAKREAEFVQARADLVALVEMLPKEHLSEKFLQHVGQQREAEIKKQKAYTLDAISEWKDPNVENSDREAMTENLARYGFPKEYLETVLDHRMVKFIRDATRQQQRVNAMLAKVKRVRETGHGQTKNASGGKKAATRKGTRVKEQAAQAQALIDSQR